MTAISTPQLAPGRWQLRSSLSSAGFGVRNFGVRTVCGTVPILGSWIDVSTSGRPTAVHAVLDLTRIETGHPRRDADLAKARLLDTGRYPQLRFEGAPQPTADGWQVRGPLAGRAICEVTLEAQVTGRNGSGAVTVHATTTVDRLALGIRAPRFLIGRRVAVVIDAVFDAPPVTA